MQNEQHAAMGRSFLWGGLILGMLLIAALLTDGFGLVNRNARTPGPPPALIHQGEKIVIPDGSALRARLTIQPAADDSGPPKLELPGLVESDPARTANVLTPVSGRVRELKVSPGDHVREGQVLALIDSADLAQAYDEDAKARSSLQLTNTTLTRQEGQFKLGTASNRDLDQARSDQEQAQAEYNRTQAHLQVLQRTAGTGPPASDKGGHSSLFALRAPFDGSVTALNIAIGNMINDPTQPVMTIADLNTVWVTALVAESDLSMVAQQQAADIRLPAYPGRILHGKVSVVSDIIESDSRRNKLRIVLANADHALKPNMFATITLLGPATSHVTVPASALLMNNDRTTVFVAIAPWTFERRSVEPQLQDGERVTIASGLKAGDPVVVKGGILLND
jgi:membrane fusion protein, heavy metal efflux system